MAADKLLPQGNIINRSRVAAVTGTYDRERRASQRRREDIRGEREFGIENRFGSEFLAVVFIKRTQQEQSVLRLDAELFDFNFIGGAHAVAQQKTAHVVRSLGLGCEQSVAEFLLEVAMQVKIGPAWIDQHFSGVVVEKERHMHAFGGHFNPLLVLARLLPLPDKGPMVVAGPLGDG